MSHSVIIFQGEKEKNIEDLHDCNLVLPTLEYHNCIWTWFDLLMSMKNDSKKILLAQVLQFSCCFCVYMDVCESIAMNMCMYIYMHGFICVYVM